MSQWPGLRPNRRVKWKGPQTLVLLNRHYNKKNVHRKILFSQNDSQNFSQHENFQHENCETNGKILQIFIDRVRAVTIRTLISIQGLLTNAIVDTGAEVTVLSERLYNLFSEDKRPKLQEAKSGLVVAEAGMKISTFGTIHVQFKLSEFEFTWSVYVAAIRDDILLGCDIIDEMDVTINTKYENTSRWHFTAAKSKYV